MKEKEEEIDSCAIGVNQSYDSPSRNITYNVNNSIKPYFYRVVYSQENAGNNLYTDG